MRLVLVRGLPGSGKSTFAVRNFPGVLRLENDMFHQRDGEYRFNRALQDKAVRWCLDATSLALDAGMDVVVANTFTRRRFVMAYKEIAEEFDADFSVYRMTGDWGSVHNVPKDVLEGMRRGFEDWEGETTVRVGILGADGAETNP